MIHLRHMKRRGMFALYDALAVVFSYDMAIIFRSKMSLPIFKSPLDVGSAFGFDMAWIPWIALPLLFIFTQYLSGIYDVWHISSFTGWIRRMLFPNVILAAAGFSGLYAVQNFNFPRSIVFVFVAFNFLLSAMWRAIYFGFANRNKCNLALVYTDARDISRSIKEFRRPPFGEHFKILACFSFDQSSASQVDGVDIFPAENFVAFSSKNNINSIVIVPGAGASSGALVEFIRAIPRNIATFFVPTIHEVLLGVLGNLRVNDLPLIEVRLMHKSPVYDSFKRVLDIFLSILVLITAAIPMLLVALIVSISSEGPIFFVQIRVGKNGRPFRIIKFRTMVYEPRRNSEFVPAASGDLRITKIGKFLRATRLDELPQVFNILKGDMSFVGPRPLVMPEVEQFEREVPAFSERKRIRPGITGLAQVSGNYETSYEIKLKYDLAYLSRRSLGLDFQIMLRTLKTVLTRAGQ